MGVFALVALLSLARLHFSTLYDMLFGTATSVFEFAYNSTLIFYANFD